VRRSGGTNPGWQIALAIKYFAAVPNILGSSAHTFYFTLLEPRILMWFPDNWRGTRLRSWLRHRATSLKVAGSIPDSVYVRWYRRSNHINLDMTYNSRTPMYPHRPSYTTHARSRAHFTSHLPTVYSPHKSSIAAYFSSFLDLKMIIVKCRNM